jgi:hypothetical protein
LTFTDDEGVCGTGNALPQSIMKKQQFLTENWLCRKTNPERVANETFQNQVVEEEGYEYEKPSKKTGKSLPVILSICGLLLIIGALFVYFAKSLTCS